MLELYQAYADYNDIMTLTEDVMKALVKSSNNSTEIEYQGKTLKFDGSFERITFYDAIKNGSENIEIWGTGEPKREFLYVDDLSNAVDFLLEKEWKDDLLNVGSGEEISIKELSYLLKEITEFDGDIIFDTTKPDGNPRKLLDSSKINSLGWKSSTSLPSGLQKTFEWYKSNY